MLTRLKGGRLYDPENGVDGEVRDLYIRSGRIVGAPADPAEANEVIDVSGRVVMAGAIDIHTHIGGGKVNIARAMLPEDHLGDRVGGRRHPHAGCGHAAPATRTAGYRYAEMGYVACFEPAMLPANARQAHLEMADTPMVASCATRWATAAPRSGRGSGTRLHIASAAEAAPMNSTSTTLSRPDGRYWATPEITTVVPNKARR